MREMRLVKSGAQYEYVMKNATCFLVYDGDELLTPNGVDARGVEALESLAERRGVTLRVLGAHEVGR